MQPMVILDGAAVAQPAVASSEPGDGSFDHGPVLAVIGQPIRVPHCAPGGRCRASCNPTLSCLPLRLRVHRVRSGQFAQATPKVATPVWLIGRVSPFGQVAVWLS